jgi:hypothetical protein
MKKDSISLMELQLGVVRKLTNYILGSKYKVDSDIDMVFISTFNDYFVMYLQNIGKL